jgi:hypothetical protein
VLRHFSLVLLLLATLAAPVAPAAAQASCAFRGGFAQLQTQIPERVGTCTADEQYRPDIGQSTQRTTNGTLVWRAVDGGISFSDGSHAWVLDPNGQVQVRGINERFRFEFNGDLAVQNGIPIVGVSETMPPGAQTFQGWQAAQLQLLLNALQKASGG